MEFKTFETERLILTPTQAADAEFIFELLNSPKWMQYIGDRNVKSVEEAENYIKNRMLPPLEKNGFSNYTVQRKTDLAKIGTCGLYDREGLDGVDIGFAFLPKFEKQGFAFEAASKLLCEAKNSFGLKTVTAFTTKDNYSSQKLLEKLGLKKSGFIRIPNDEEELLFYKIEL